MKMYQTLSYDCSPCGGRGYVFYGDNEDYTIEPCECVANGQRSLLLLFKRTTKKKSPP